MAETIRGELTKMNRHRNSRDGNPRYRLWINGQTYITPIDSMLGYDLSYSWVGSWVTAEVTNEGVIISITRS